MKQILSSSKGTVFISVTLAVVLTMTAGAFAAKVGPSNYPHTTDGYWTDWYPGTEDPFEWYDIGFFKGLYSYYSADYIPATGRLYVMNDFFGNNAGLNPGEYNTFKVWIPGAAATDFYEIHVNWDNTVTAWKNGVLGTPEIPVPANGAYHFTKSPFFPDTDHTVYEIDLPAPITNVPVSMSACDPVNGTTNGNQGGAFVGTMTPLSTGGVEIQQVIAPISFSVDGGYYNELRNGVTGPAANPAEGIHSDHTSPDDVYSLGPAGGHNFATEGEIFQSSGILGAPPDGTNIDRLSGALGIGVGPHDPPPETAPSPNPPGALGLQPNDNINSLSYGKDGGDVIHFSVDTESVGQEGTDVHFEAVESPAPGMLPGTLPNNGGGGDPCHEAAGDIFVSRKLNMFGKYKVLMPAVARIKLNALELDEAQLGLQAPANTGSAIGTPEDDLDALEMSNTDEIDADRDGLVDNDSRCNVFFTLDRWSPTITNGGSGFEACDILVTRGGTTSVAGYASGVLDIGLLEDDSIDALVLSDTTLGAPTPNGILDVGRDEPWDEALFSLSPDSPSLWGLDGIQGTADDASAADIFYTDFNRSFNPLLSWGSGGSLYVTAEGLGLLSTDNIDAADIAPEPTTLILLFLGALTLLRRRAT